MTHGRTLHRRAGPLFGVVLLVVAAALAVTPAGSAGRGHRPDPRAQRTPHARTRGRSDARSDARADADPRPRRTPDPTPAPTPDPRQTPATRRPIRDRPIRRRLTPIRRLRRRPIRRAAPDAPIRRRAPRSFAPAWLTSDAPAAGRHRVDPGRDPGHHARSDVPDAASDARLVAVIPPGWARRGRRGGGRPTRWPRPSPGCSATSTPALTGSSSGCAPRSPRRAASLPSTRRSKPVSSRWRHRRTAVVGLRVAPELVVEHVRSHATPTSLPRRPTWPPARRSMA